MQRFPPERSWCPLTLLCYRGSCTHEQTERFLLSITCCFFYPCCQWHTPNSPIGLSLLFWTPQPSRVSGGTNSSVSMLKANCRSQTFIVILQFGAETFHFLLHLKNECPFRHCYRLQDTVCDKLSLPHTHTHNFVCVCCVYCACVIAIAINESQFSWTALKPQPVFWCKFPFEKLWRQHFQSLSNLSSIIVHLPGWYENNEEWCVFISKQLCRSSMLNFRIVGGTLTWYSQIKHDYYAFICLFL